MHENSKQRSTGRQSAIRYTVCAITTLLFVAAGFAALKVGKRRERPAISRPAPVPLGQSIESKYGVKLVVGHKFPVATLHGQIRALNAEKSQIDRYITILASEFLRYPPAFVAKSGLKRIILCRELNFMGQKRTAVPDFEHDSLYLDVVMGDYDSDYQRRVIHHEFFHMVDYKDDGELYSDKSWARFNPRDFQYGSGGAQMQDDPHSGVRSKRQGFLNRYSTSGVEEDKAELFAYMMTDYDQIESLAASDPVIRKKLQAMKALLSNFCPEMNESFWRKAGGPARAALR
jgi:hypothetical protein